MLNFFFFPWARRNQVCMLINTLQSLTCDYVGCILSTCQKIKSSTLLHLCKDFLHFFCTLTAQEKTDFGIFVQHNKTVYIKCLHGGRKDSTYIYFNLWGHEKSRDWELHSTKCNMNLLMYCITDIHIQFTTFLHVYKDYLFWDSANVIVIHNSFMWYLYVS